MFKRKSEEEVERIRQELKNESRDLTHPVLFGFCAGGITGVMVYLFGTKFTKPLEVGLSKSILISLFVAFIAFIILYSIQRFSGRSIANEQTLKVCPKCLKSYNGTGSICSCGSSLEPREFYKYVGN